MFDVSSPAPVLEQETPAPVAKKTRKPRPPVHDFKDGCGRVFANRHSFGGGWVAATASVEASAFVAKGAQVYNNAVVKDRARVEERSQIHGNAVIQDSACVSGRAQVGGASILYNSVTVKDNAIVHGGQFYGTSAVSGRAVVNGHPMIYDTSVKGYVLVSRHANLQGCCLDGRACVTDNAIAINTTITGYVTVRHNTRVINTQLEVAGNYATSSSSRREAHEVGRLLVSDHAVIVAGRHSAPVHYRGHTKVLNSVIQFMPSFAGPGWSEHETGPSEVIIDRSFTHRSAFDDRNDPPDPPDEPTPPPPPVVYTSNRAPYDFASVGQRRIVAMKESP